MSDFGNFNFEAQPKEGPRLLDNAYQAFLARNFGTATEYFDQALRSYAEHIEQWKELCEMGYIPPQLRAKIGVPSNLAMPGINPARLRNPPVTKIARRRNSSDFDSDPDEPCLYRSDSPPPRPRAHSPPSPRADSPPPRAHSPPPADGDRRRAQFHMDSASDFERYSDFEQVNLSDASLVSEAYSEWEHKKVPAGQPPQTWQAAVDEDTDAVVREPKLVNELKQRFATIAAVPAVQPTKIRIIKCTKSSVKMLCKLIYHSLHLQSLHVRAYCLPDGARGGMTADRIDVTTPTVSEILEMKEQPEINAALRMNSWLDYTYNSTDSLPEVIKPARLASLQNFAESVPFETSQLVASLPALPQLRHLQIWLPRFMGMTEETNLGMALLKTKARSVVLEGFGVGRAGCIFLSDYISKNKSPCVQHLALLGGSFSLSDQVMASFKTNNTILSFRFTNDVSYRGLKSLFSGLGSNTNFTLAYLDLRYTTCRINDTQTNKLLNLLAGNRSLVYCDLRGTTNLDDAFREGVAQIVARNVAQRQAVWRQLTDGIGPDLADVVFSFAFGELEHYPCAMNQQGYVPLQ